MRLTSSKPGEHLGKYISLVIIHDVDTFYAYRPAYDSLKKLPTQFPGVPLMALTATATSSTMAHLKQLLCEPVCEISSVKVWDLLQLS